MADTLSTIQTKIAVLVDQTTTAPTAGNAEWELRRTFINRAIEEWGQAYNWDAMRRISYLSVSGGASIALPGDFRKTAGFPVLYTDGAVTTGEQWPEIQPNEASGKSSTEKFYYILGNRGEGFTMIWNPGTLTSGASLLLQYYSFPTSLSTTTSVAPVYDPEYLVDRTVAYIFEMRNDGRFQEVEAKARERLLLMIDNENEKSRAYRNRVETPEKLYYNFRIGRD